MQVEKVIPFKFPLIWKSKEFGRLQLMLLRDDAIVPIFCRRSLRLTKDFTKNHKTVYCFGVLYWYIGLAITESQDYSLP